MWLARHDAGTLPKRKEPVNLVDVASDAVNAIQPVAAREEISVLVSHPKNREALVRGDAASLRRLVLILLDNAIKFSFDRGQVELRISLAHRVQVEVRDNGPGIPPEYLPHVFERFYRPDPSRTTPGAGLGLSIARAIVEHHQGTIAIESEATAGTVVRVTFPHPAESPAMLASRTGTRGWAANIVE